MSAVPLGAPAPQVLDRRDYLGGTDAAAILGISPWRTRLDVYREKLGESEPTKDSESMFWGRVHEPAIAERYSQLTGCKVSAPTKTFRHPKHEWMGGNIDRLVLSKDGPLKILEIKTSRKEDGWGEDGSDEVPEHYAVQCHHYMGVTGSASCDIALLYQGSQLRLFHLQRDERLIEFLIDEERKFWFTHVVAKNPPAPVNVKEASTRWKVMAGKRHVDGGLRASVEEHVELGRQIKVLEDRRERRQLEIVTAMEDAEILCDESDQVIATWKETKRQHFDFKAFKEAHPDLYHSFCEERSTRTFLPKLKGGSLTGGQ